MKNHINLYRQNVILPRDLGLFLSSHGGVSLFTPGVWVYFFFLLSVGKLEMWMA